MTAARRLRATLACGLLAGAIAWLAGLAWFVRALDLPPAADRPTDAIVVLTGGSQRLASGLALLKAGKAKQLFVSGVGRGVATGDMMRDSGLDAGTGSCCIVLGHAAEDTEGNAIETADWLQAQGYHSLRLVTANYHMRRALLEFRRVLPPSDVIIPDPVVPDGAKSGTVLGWRGTAHVVVIEYLKYLGALARPILKSRS